MNAIYTINQKAMVLVCIIKQNKKTVRSLLYKIIYGASEIQIL